jgi:ParB family transcriptional regulator, chromosome partitioning protein
VGSREKQRMIQVDPRKILPNPHQPRKDFKEKSIEALAESIEQSGLLQPLVVWQKPQMRQIYLLAGERRLRACLKLGLDRVNVIVSEKTPEEVLVAALAENLQREDLNIFEEARAYKKMIEHLGVSQEQCAKTLGVERSSVANALRMLTLNPAVQQDVLSGRISAGHGRSLLGLETNVALAVRERIIKKKLSVRQSEALVKRLKKSVARVKENKKDPHKDPNLLYLESALSQHLGTRVVLKGSQGLGKIEVSFFSSADLERLLGVLGLSR